MSLPRPPLLLLTDRAQATAALETVVAEALAGGCRWILLREKDLEPAARFALLRRVLALARPHGATVLLGADAETARRAGAGGVHLPAGNDPARARAALGPRALIGVSAHNAAEAQAAERAGADYVTLSPVFASASKPGYGPALGVEGLRALASRLAVPILALGGIGAGNAASCLAAGAAGVAVMGGIMRAPEPRSATLAVLAGLAGAAGAAGPADPAGAGLKL